MDGNLRREIILDNLPLGRYLVKETEAPANINFMMKIEGGKVKDIHFDGEACAISTSASSILIRSLIGKSVEEAKEILINYQKMINEEDYDKELLGELNVYDELQPNRKNCALLPSVAVEKMFRSLEDGKKC